MMLKLISSSTVEPLSQAAHEIKKKKEPVRGMNKGTGLTPSSEFRVSPGGEAKGLTEQLTAGRVHLPLAGRLDSPRAFLPPPPPGFLSLGFLPPPELLFFFPFFTTSHLPTEPLFEAMSVLDGVFF